MARIVPVLLFALAPLSAQLIQIPAGSLTIPDLVSGIRTPVAVDAFLLGETEVTQAEYEAITRTNPSTWKGPQRPVENVSWFDAIRYCNLRSRRENLKPCYDEATGRRDVSCTGYRLPTEAEWLLAAGPSGATPPAATLGDPSTKTTAVFKAALDRGTTPVRTHAANAAGVYDMAGNVWEWCDDWFRTRTSASSTRNPTGPLTGLERVIRGGSFVSSTSRWSRDYRSSMPPANRGRYTGFRVARTIAPPAELRPATAPFIPHNTPPAGFETATGNLTPLVPPGATAASWPAAAAKIRAKWDDLLAAPKPATGRAPATPVQTVEQTNFTGEIVALEVEPGIREKIYILRPSPASWTGPRPVLIVPFYDIDTPSNTDLGGRIFSPDRGVNAFAHTAAQHGYIAVAVRWFGESYGESYSEAVANLTVRHPGATGLGKWVTDARRVLDYVVTIPGADPQRIAIMGHSLGGKMALYAAALDTRIKATVSSELGMGFRMSNYEDYWYLGEKLATAPAGTDQHELLALIAPRPFLLIGGDEYDKADSWHYINAAKPVYKLLGAPDAIGYLNHGKGHTPTPDSIGAAFQWLDRFMRP